jgi:hypothetical protein
MDKENTDLITKKEGYQAMLYAIKTYWENSGSNDLTDILNGGEYWPGTERPADSAFWDYWTEAIDKVRKDGPMFKVLTKE